MKQFTIILFILIFCISSLTSIGLSQESQEVSTGLAPRSSNFEFRTPLKTSNLELLFGGHGYGIDAQTDALWRIPLFSPQTPTVIGPISDNLFAGDFGYDGGY